MAEQLTAPALVRFPRPEFLAERWDYRPGEHVTLLAPTQSGKTTLALQLLNATVSEQLPGVVLVVKPRDAVVERLRRQAGFKVVRSWPPVRIPGAGPPRGYVLWPRLQFDPKHDNALLYAECRKAILDSYRRGNRILFCDETYRLSTLNLDPEMITVWASGASMGTGIWAATQRPAMIPQWAYSQAEHIFIAYDPDRRARQRYDEIGGVDPDLVRSAVVNLGQYEWLYIRRTGRTVCVIER